MPSAAATHIYCAPNICQCRSCHLTCYPSECLHNGEEAAQRGELTAWRLQLFSIWELVPFLQSTSLYSEMHLVDLFCAPTQLGCKLQRQGPRLLYLLTNSIPTCHSCLSDEAKMALDEWMMVIWTRVCMNTKATLFSLVLPSPHRSCRVQVGCPGNRSWPKACSYIADLDSGSVKSLEQQQPISKLRDSFHCPEKKPHFFWCPT